MASGIEWLDIGACKDIARNSPKLLEMEQAAARGICRLIYESAPHTTSHQWSYRDNFRIENRLFPRREGHVMYLIAERFQWRWIEYGWTNWRSRMKYPGKYIMTNALKAYAWGSEYGEGVT